MTITQAELKRLLTYDPETGIFKWNVYRSDNARAGDIAGAMEKTGYVDISVNAKRYKAHRLAFLYMTGSWPKNQIDHKNKVRNDNKWLNLREASASENAQNRSVSIRSSTGHKCIIKKIRGYQVVITRNGVRYTKHFVNLDLAIAWRDAKLIELHGSFAHT